MGKLHSVISQFVINTDVISQWRVIHPKSVESEGTELTSSYAERI